MVLTEKQYKLRPRKYHLSSIETVDASATSSEKFVVAYYECFDFWACTFSKWRDNTKGPWQLVKSNNWNMQKVDRSQPWCLTLTCDLQFQPLRAMVVTHTLAKDQGHRSVGLKDREETDGRTDEQTDRWMEAIALPPMLMRSVTIMQPLNVYHANYRRHRIVTDRRVWWARQSAMFK